MSQPQVLQRDAFIDEIYEAAKKNPNIYFLCCDLGAKALDRFKVDLKEQFIHTGISEQNMMDIAAGLALNGKIVYAYAMAPFVTFRCYEQIKVAIASMNLPVTILGVGVGYSYDDAGPTHYATEDIGCMRSLANIEILSPGDHESVIQTARLTYTKPALRYIRLDRKYLPTVYETGDSRFMRDGFAEIEPGKDTCIVTYGYMIQKAREVRKNLQAEGIDVAIVDAYRMKPVSPQAIRSVFQKYSKVVTLEEHFLSAGLGSVVLEAFNDAGVSKPVKRIGIVDKYYCENGGRDYLHKLSKIDVATVTNEVRSYCGQPRA